LIIVTLDVHPDWRRRGIGRLLLRRIHAELATEGIENVFLHVAVENLGAQRLYIAEGYQAGRMARDYYGTHADARRMRRELTTP
jgi:ribosomal-protein-alanine N-acetyltransferase